MKVKKTITLLLENDEDLKKTLVAFRSIQNQVSPICFNDGKPLRAVPLQAACYHSVKNQLCSQMTIGAIRLVAAAYKSAKKQSKVTKVFQFKKAHALFLIGTRGRDCSFTKNGKLSIWTIGGRKKIDFKIPAAFQQTFDTADSYASLLVFQDKKHRLIGRLCLTFDLADPSGHQPVGIDLNETNAVVATDNKNQTFFKTGKKERILNKRNRKTKARLQRKLDSRKAEKRTTRSVRRCLKRLSRKQSNRTKTFAHTVAKQLCEWAPANSVLVFEKLDLPDPKGIKIKKGKKATKRQKAAKAINRRLSSWPRGMIRNIITYKAPFYGLAVDEVDPSYTSQICSKCGRLGKRNRHQFSCECGHKDHADINASKNIRDRYTVLRYSGHTVNMPRSSGTSVLRASSVL